MAEFDLFEFNNKTISQSSKINIEEMKQNKEKGTDNSPYLIPHIIPLQNKLLNSITFQTLNFKSFSLSMATIDPNLFGNTLQKHIKNADVISHIYEGGFKLWEGSKDLINYFLEYDKENLMFKGKSVLELGCGHGMVGIFCHLKGASHITFQDLNHEVIELATIPNIISNTSDNIDFQLSTNNDSHPFSNSDKIRCIAGDWMSEEMQPLLGYQKYDLIVTSETFYELNNYSTLLSLFKYCLKPGGMVIIALKRYYFGFGGGTFVLSEMMEKTSLWHYQHLKTIMDGCSNIRDIVCLKLHNNQ